MSLINEALQRAREEAVRREAVERGVPLPPAPRRASRNSWLPLAVLVLAIALAASVITLLGLSRQIPATIPEATVTTNQAALQVPSTDLQVLEADSIPANQPASAERAVDQPKPLPLEAPTVAEDRSLPATESIDETPATTGAPVSKPVAEPQSVESVTEPIAERAPVPQGSEAAIFIRHADLGNNVSIELGGIAWSETGPYALLNGRVVGVGESVSGYVVRSIDPQEVRLEGPERQIALRLK